MRRATRPSPASPGACCRARGEAEIADVAVQRTRRVCSTATPCWSPGGPSRSRSPALRGNRPDPERHCRGRPGARHAASRRGRGIDAGRPGRMAVPSGRAPDQAVIAAARPRARRRRAAGRATTSCRCSATCSTRSRWRWSAARLEREAREFAALRERDRLRSALLSSIGDDLSRGSTAIAAAARALQARRRRATRASVSTDRLRSARSSTAMSPT